jgi:hypothetical protein
MMVIMSRRTSPPRPPAGPPASIEAGAALVRQHAVKLYDKQDGQGVDWRTITGVLFRSAFDVLDQLPPDQRKVIANRVHERSYDALTDHAGASNHDPAGAVSAPSNIDYSKSPRPRPPNGSV